ncbi:glycosyltransferase family 2 protein [Mucilaginibacter sp.]
MNTEKILSKVSIITVVYNAVNTIENTIQSVIEQSYPNIEYIIIDGGSTDGTLDIINLYKAHIKEIISGPDEGIADAFNKGISLATGEWIGMINADDWYAYNAVERMMKNVTGDDAICCGNLTLMGENGYAECKKSKVGWLNLGMYIMHPTCFIRKNVYQNVGLYDIKLKIAVDFDMFLRLKTAGYKIKYIDEMLAFMRTGGASSDVISMHREELTVMRRYLHSLSYLVSASFNYLNRLRWRFFYNSPFADSKY